MNLLDQRSINVLNAEQTITSVFDAVKELIENSLDSGAKTIKVKLVDIGLKLIQVTDDGSGITEEGREKCCLPHTTSKIRSIDDLNNDLCTFGFRGEALHSLCCLGDVSIVTRCKNESEASELTFNNEGYMKKIKPISAPIGTTVKVSNLLSNLPVRVRHERSSFNYDTFRNMLSGYFLSAPKVRFVLECPPSPCYTRPPLTSVCEAAAYEFGPNIVASLSERTVELYHKDIKIVCRALVPSVTSDWKDSSTTKMNMKQYLIVNGRPVENLTVKKAVNEAYWKKYGQNPKKFARFVIYLDFFRDQAITSSLIDVNKDSSKKLCGFSDQSVILDIISQITSFEKPQVKKFEMDSWPSTEVSIEETDFPLGPLTSAIWSSSGSFDDISLFTVKAVNRTFLVALKTDNLFESCGATKSEIERIPIEQMVLIYWDKILAIDQKNKVVKILYELLNK